jgi:hypothetical protein
MIVYDMKGEYERNTNNNKCWIYSKKFNIFT